MGYIDNTFSKHVVTLEGSGEFTCVKGDAGFCVVKDSAIREIFDEETADNVLKHRAAFIEETMARQIGLYAASQEGENNENN